MATVPDGLRKALSIGTGLGALFVGVHLAWALPENAPKCLVEITDYRRTLTWTGEASYIQIDAQRACQEKNSRPWEFSGLRVRLVGSDGVVLFSRQTPGGSLFERQGILVSQADRDGHYFVLDLRRGVVQSPGKRVELPL